MTATPADAALRLLSPAQLAFLERLPKAELHAHLNGSIPLPVLQELAQEYLSAPSITPATGEHDAAPLAAEVLSGLQHLQAGCNLNTIDDFFVLFRSQKGHFRGAYWDLGPLARHGPRWQADGRERPAQDHTGCQGVVREVW